MPKLSELADLRSGFHLRGPADARPGGNHLVIQLGDIRDGEIKMDRVIRMDLDRARRKDYLAPGDILLRSRGASYEAALVTGCPDGLLAAAPLYIVRLTAPGVEGEYIVWYVNRPTIQAQLAASARGTHVPTVGIGAFAGLNVIMPPLAAQHKVLDMERLFREEKELTLKHIEQRAQLVRAAQDNILTGGIR